MPESEYVRWQMYFKTRPIDTKEAQMAVLLAMYSNAHGAETEVEEFIFSSPKPLPDMDTKPVDKKELDSIVRMMFGG
jgi:hypothetical protein